MDSHTVNMGDLDPDWYLQAWAAYLGKRQADLVSELEMHKNAAHRLWHSRQPYRRQDINAVSAWLGISPYELLMPPKEALALRQFREAAKVIAGTAAEDPPALRPKAAKHRRPARKPGRAA
jgi:hypothetical protein